MLYRTVSGDGDSASSMDMSPQSVHSSKESVKNGQLSAYMECEAIDEYNFQVQAALLSTKVLKLLEKEDAQRKANASKLKHFSKGSFVSSSSVFGNSNPTSSVPSGIFPTVARTRSSSWISTQSMRGHTNSQLARSPAASYMEGPLLDRILDSCKGNPVPVPDIVKMMNLLVSLHAYCPSTNSIGGTMGAVCTVSDYTQVIASADAMMRLVVAIRQLIEENAPTSLISATVPANGRLIVCGDTHGQLEDLVWVFFKNGLPSPSNIYIFNGDICDRGGHAIEIFLILFLFKLNSYNSVHIIRGNHEDDYCNIYYGFLAELKHKFGPIPGGNLHSEFLKLFYSMPLACVIDSWIGQYRCNITGAVIDLSLASLSHSEDKSPSSSPKSIGQTTEVVLKRKDASTGHRAFVRSDPGELVFEKRTAKRSCNADGHNIITWGSGSDSWEYISPRILVLHGGIPVPPSQSTSTNSSVLLKHFRDLPHRMKIPPAPKTVLEQWMYQILWSDPQEPDGPKGRGTPFLSTHTKAFADANNLAAIIRAHQVPSNQRGVAFHHKQRLITIFTASNYCGSSQNYGGVAIFTPSLFPQLLMNRTLFEHWAPPLGVTRDVLAKHQNATQDVRMFIAHEIETERAPMDKNSPGMLNHLQQKVGEYVSALIVQHKRQLWNHFYAKYSVSGRQGFVLAIHDWEMVCSSIIGSHFPWLGLIEQLELDLTPGNRGIDYVQFLNRFKATVRIGETALVDTWESAVVRGFFHEIISRDVLVQQALLTEYYRNNSKTLTGERFREILQANCPSVTAAQAFIMTQALLETSTGSPSGVSILSVFASLSEYVRSYFSLVESAPDIVTSEEVIDVGRMAIEFFPLLRQKVFSKYSDAEDSIVRFFKEVLAASDTSLVVSLGDATSRLEQALGDLRMKEYAGKMATILRFVAAEENELGVGPDDTEISLLKFFAACYIEGTNSGRVLRDRIVEHANAAVYFHRNALRVACVHMDKSRSGQIDRHAFYRAFNALNQSLDAEWRMTKHQQRCIIEYLRWQENDVSDVHAHDGDVMADIMASLGTEDEDKLLVINYDVFLDMFEISDCQRMSRTCSFGWHLVKDSLLDDTLMQ